jgi:hypothetical protein
MMLWLCESPPRSKKPCRGRKNTRLYENSIAWRNGRVRSNLQVGPDPRLGATGALFNRPLSDQCVIPDFFQFFFQRTNLLAKKFSPRRERVIKRQLLLISSTVSLKFLKLSAITIKSFTQHVKSAVRN